MEDFMMKIFNENNIEVIRIFVEVLKINGYRSIVDFISGRLGKYNFIYYYLKIYFKVEKRYF